MELLFLFCFSLHNLEEALWLPAWSVHAGKYHKAVKDNEFRIAVMAVTAAGYLITFQFFVFSSYPLSGFIYRGFVLMMVLNAFFPHVAATMVLKKYAPGTLTGILLNVPVGTYIIIKGIHSGSELAGTVMAGSVISIAVLLMIRYIFEEFKK